MFVIFTSNLLKIVINCFYLQLIVDYNYTHLNIAEMYRKFSKI